MPGDGLNSSPHSGSCSSLSCERVVTSRVSLNSCWTESLAPGRHVHSALRDFLSRSVPWSAQSLRMITSVPLKEFQWSRQARTEHSCLSDAEIKLEICRFLLGLSPRELELPWRSTTTTRSSCGDFARSCLHVTKPGTRENYFVSQCSFEWAKEKARHSSRSSPE